MDHMHVLPNFRGAADYTPLSTIDTVGSLWDTVLQRDSVRDFCEDDMGYCDDNNVLGEEPWLLSKAEPQPLPLTRETLAASATPTS